MVPIPDYSLDSHLPATASSRSREEWIFSFPNRELLLRTDWSCQSNPPQNRIPSLLPEVKGNGKQDCCNALTASIQLQFRQGICGCPSRNGRWCYRNDRLFNHSSRRQTHLDSPSPETREEPQDVLRDCQNRGRAERAGHQSDFGCLPPTRRHELTFLGPGGATSAGFVLTLLTTRDGVRHARPEGFPMSVPDQKKGFGEVHIFIKYIL
jgi:hypothetical protein